MASIAARPERQVVESGGREVSGGEPLTHGQVLVSLLVSFVLSFLG